MFCRLIERENLQVLIRRSIGRFGPVLTVTAEFMDAFGEITFPFMNTEEGFREAEKKLQSMTDEQCLALGDALIKGFSPHTVYVEQRLKGGSPNA